MEEGCAADRTILALQSRINLHAAPPSGRPPLRAAADQDRAAASGHPNHQRSSFSMTTAAETWRRSVGGRFAAGAHVEPRLTCHQAYIMLCREDLGELGPT